MSRYSANLSVMLKASEKAARSLRRDFGEVEQLQVSRKGPADFVTAADKRADEIIRDELSYARSDFAFLMEESGQSGPKDAESRWIVDPLDGTTNFLHGIPHWCISIALETRGEIVAALVHDPIKDEIFTAEKGQGAFMRRKRLRVSGRSDPSMAVIAAGAGCMHKTMAGKEQFFKEYNAVVDLAPNVRRFGAAALDLAYVAAGRYEAFWERGLMPWDGAAGALIVREAGGFICDLDNDRNDPVYTGNVLSGNEAIFADLKKVLKAIK